MNTLPTIHGLLVVALVHIPSLHKGTQRGYMVVVDKGPCDETVDPDEYDRYVSALWYEGDPEWVHGNYFSDYSMAFDDMVDRAWKRLP